MENYLKAKKELTSRKCANCKSWFTPLPNDQEHYLDYFGALVRICDYCAKDGCNILSGLRVCAGCKDTLMEGNDLYWMDAGTIRAICKGCFDDVVDRWPYDWSVKI